MLEIKKFDESFFSLIKDNLDEYDDFWNEATLKSEIEKEENYYIVLIDNAKDNNNSIIGFAGIWINVDRIELNNIVIKKICRGRGYSKLLLEELINKATEIGKEKSIKLMSLEVSSENIRAINLYKSYDFYEVGRRKNYYFGKYDAILMDKNI